MPITPDYFFTYNSTIPIDSGDWVTVNIQQSFEECRREWEERTYIEMEQREYEKKLEKERKEDTRKYPLFFSKKGQPIRFLNIKGKV